MTPVNWEIKRELVINQHLLFLLLLGLPIIVGRHGRNQRDDRILREHELYLFLMCWTFQVFYYLQQPFYPWFSSKDQDYLLTSTVKLVLGILHHLLFLLLCLQHPCLGGHQSALRVSFQVKFPQCIIQNRDSQNLNAGLSGLRLCFGSARG